MRTYKGFIFAILVALSLVACRKDFLNTLPLGAPSDATFWTSVDNARSWINYDYRSLPGADDYIYDPMSDDCVGAGDLVAEGLQVPNSSLIGREWDYSTIRHCLELMQHLDDIPNISEDDRNKLAGQARFLICFRYFEMITLYGDVPFIKTVLPLAESDLPKSPKDSILRYILVQLDSAANELPLTWPESDVGRITKGAALTLKARVCLYNSMWKEAAEAASSVMELKIYSLHPKFNELFLTSFNNKTNEVILAHQYAEGLYTHTLCFSYGFYTIGGTSSSLPTPDLVNSFECKDGLPIDQSKFYDPQHPWDNRDPRFRMTFIVPFENFNGQVYDPVNNINDRNAAKTYIYFKKYIADMQPQQRTMWNNWIIFRYADVLLMYAEAENEYHGPGDSVYDAVDQVRQRAGMPKLDRVKYASKEELREAIRHERRVEFAGEGLRYYDILRWKIADKVLNKEVYSFEIPGVLTKKDIETRVFDSPKDYLWPIPQSAIDDAKNLKQNPLWE